MSGRKSKKNQRLGSSRRGPKGLNRNIEKDDDDDGSQQSEDGRDEFHTTSYYHATQFDHPPSSSIEQQTSALECPPHARGHKDSLMETEMPERKRKMGSTRKSTGRFKGEGKLDDVRTTEELDEEYVTQPSTSTTEEQHASLTEEEQSSLPSDLSLQTKSSGFGKESGTTRMFAVSENKEKDTIHHQEITSHSHEVLSDVPIDEAVGPSVHSIAVKVAEREDSVMLNEPKTLSHQETQIASTSGQKRRMGSTRRPLGGKNGENVGVQEHLRNMTENESKAEVMSEAKWKMSEEMAQMSDDVARDDPLSHTESALLLRQSLLADRAELKEPDVSAGTETMNQSVGFPLVDSEKPLPETFSHHGTPLLNEALDFEFGSHSEDLDVLNKVLKEAGSHLSDNSQHVSDTRKDTNPSYDFRDVNTEAKKVVLKQKEEPQIEELALHDQESLLSQHDIATLDNNYDCSMVHHIVIGSTSFDMPMSNISHAEPTTTNLPHEMRDAVEERQEIRIEMKQENNFCNVASVTCDTLTDLVSITEEDEDPHILATRENENMSNERGSETEYAFEMTDQGDVSDHNVTQIIMDVRDNEKDGETSTETIWISHQKPCDVSTENKELYKGQEHYSSNISLTHSPTQDDAGKMLENEEVRKDKKETENTVVNDVTSKSEEMFSFEDSATDRGSHAHQQLFIQSPDKEGYDLHENVTEKSEKEEILFSVESEYAAFDRGNERREGTDGVKEMDAAPVLTLDVGDADLHLEIEAWNKTFDSTNSEADGPEENINGAGVLIRENKVIGNTVEDNMTTESDFLQTSPDAHMEALKISKNAEKEVSGEINTIPEQSDISIIPADSHREETHSKSSPVIHKRKMGSTRRPLKGNTGRRKDHNEKEIFNLEDEPRPDESRYAEVSICDISESQTITKMYAGSQENTGDVKIVPAEGDTESHSENKSFDSTAFEGEVEVREAEVIGDSVGSNMTTESDFHQTSDANMETLKVSENSDGDVSSDPIRNSQSEIEPENKMIELTSEAERTEDTICEASVSVREDEFTVDTVIVDSITIESDLLQSDTLNEANLEALKVSKSTESVSAVTDSDLLVQDDVTEGSRKTDMFPELSDINVIPEYSHGEEASSNSSPIVHKRKMGSTRRPLKGKKGQRKELEHHEENETLASDSVINAEKQIFSLENEPSSDESTLQCLKDGGKEQEMEISEKNDVGPVEGSESALLQSSCSSDLVSEESTAISICHITESQTLTKTDEVPQENSGEAERVAAEEDKDFRLEIDSQNKTFDLATSEAEETEKNIQDVSVTLIREVEVIGDTDAVESNMTTESDFLQTSPDAHMEALNVSENAVKEVPGETNTIPKQSDISIVHEDYHEEEAHSKTSQIVHKRKMGSTRRPLKGKNGQRKEIEHHYENETLDSEGMINAEKQTFSLENEPCPDESTLQSTKDGAKEQEMEICEKNDVGPVEGAESALLQSSCSSDLVSEESTAISICHITESQILTKIDEVPQENTGEAERVAAEEDKDFRRKKFTLEIDSQNKTFDLATSEAEETEKNIQDVSVTLIREVEVIGDTVTVESNMTTESDFLQTSSDAHMEALKVSKNAEKEVSGETNTIPEQSDISIIPADSHREETHSKSSPVIHKRKMGSTRRPLKGNTGRRKDHNEKEIFNLEDEPSPDESRYAEVSICDISESQTITKIHAGSQENTGDVKIVPAEGDTELHSENKTIYLPAFEGEATEKNICAASALDRKVEFIGDAVIVENNMTTESDLIQNYTSTDAKPEALISEIAENEISGKTDTISKQSVPNIIPEDLHGDEVHSKWSLNLHKRKMGSTRRPLRGNKEQRKVRVESNENNGDSEGVSEEEGTETHSEIQNRENVVDYSVTQEIINIRDVEGEERKTTKTVDMSVQELCDDLEQRSDASQTQTDPSQDTGSHLLEFQERTADFVRDSNSLSDVVMSDALLMEETQIHVSSNDVPPTEVVEINPVSKKSMQKRKMGSTRKRGKRMVNDEELEEKDGETENTTIDDETTKSEEKLTLDEAITGSPVHQQLFSSSADKEGHDIQDIISKSDVQAENSEQNDPNSTINPKLLIESECSSNFAAEMVSDLPLGDVDTYLDPKQSVIPKESHREDQPNFNPVVQKRKMGSTRKTLRGNKGQGRTAEFKKMDGDSEGMTQEQDTEPHLETSARKNEFDEEVEQNFPVEFSHPMASSNMFPEPENRVKEVSHIIHDLSEVSEEKGMDNTGNDSNSLSEAINLNEGRKDNFFLTVSHEDAHQIVSEPEQTENTHKVIPTQELRATQDDNSRKIPATQEKRRKMGSTRRSPRGMLGKNMADNEDVLGVAEDRETEKAADDLEEALSISQSKKVSSVSTTDLESEMFIGATDFKVENDHVHSSRPTVPEIPENTLQICDNQLVNADVTKHPQSETLTTEKRRKMGSTRKNLREGKIQGKRDGYEDIETEDTNLQMSQDSKMSLVRENVGQQTTHGYSDQSEGSLLSEIERALNKTSQSSLSCDWELIVKEPNPGDSANAPDLNMPENSEIKSLQPMPSAHSEPNSPGGRRRKMGSTRKNPRQQLKAEREDEDKEDGEIDENSKANKQEKKDLERVEVSVVHNISENRLNKEYLDVSSAHISSDQLEESTNPVSQEKTSPSTKRKFGSRRANKGKQGLGRLADSDFGNQLEDGDHKPDSSEVKDKLHSDDLAVCEPCLTLQPENQPASEQRNMEAKNEEAAPKGTDAGFVSLDQIIKHDTTGAKQTVNLKNRISDTKVVQFNVVMVGNSCVGKTSFIRRFHEGQFTEDYRSTIGVDTCVQTLALPDSTVKLHIWDTAGQERFHSITTQVFHKADGLLLMYEITCSKSFISVRDWISQARERAPDDVIMMLLGNKNDSVKREVQIQEGADLAREYNIHFMECSAATGANVSESMRSLAELLVQRKSQKEKHTTLRREPAQKKSGCC